MTISRTSLTKSEKEDLIDKYESRLGEYLVQLTKREMNTAQTRQVSLYLHTINNFERIGDHASYIAHMSNEMHENHTQFSEEAWGELNVAMEAVREVINITYDAFLNDDKEEAQRITPLGMVIGRLCDELKMHHVARMSKGGCGLEEGASLYRPSEQLQSYRIPLCKCNGGIA